MSMQSYETTSVMTGPQVMAETSVIMARIWILCLIAGSTFRLVTYPVDVLAQ